MATPPSSPVAAPQDSSLKSRQRRNVLVIILSLLVLAILVGWQLLSVRSNTDPTILGHPLSNSQTHLHTVAIGGKPGLLYLGTHYGIFTSTDGGRTWPQARGELNTLMVTTIIVNPQNANLLALVAVPSVSGSAAEGVYFSSDGGTTWTLHNPRGLSLSAYPYTVQAGTGGSEHFYAFYLNGGWFETRDLGQHWRALAQHNLPAMQTPQLLSFANNPDHLLLGGEQGLFESKDDGQTWSALTSVQGSVLSLVASKTTPAVIFCATDQGLYTWRDGTTQVKQIGLPGPITFSRLAVDATGSILYGLAGQNLEYSQDGGVHWMQRKHFNRGDMTALVIDPQHAEKFYVGFFLPPQVIYSTDSGENWQILTGGNTVP
ncbi:MAG: hypothetical protein JO215_09160 [Ktedonobacteraceae bacterium]|nr:hypothetical protein [Ktedonobacteraceae bacterium]